MDIKYIFHHGMLPEGRPRYQFECLDVPQISWVNINAENDLSLTLWEENYDVLTIPVEHGLAKRHIYNKNLPWYKMLNAWTIHADGSNPFEHIHGDLVENENGKFVVSMPFEGAFSDNVLKKLESKAKVKNIPLDRFIYMSGTQNAEELYGGKGLEFLYANPFIRGVKRQIHVLLLNDDKLFESISNIKTQKKKYFTCFNRMARNHRVLFTTLCHNEGLIEKSFFSSLLVTGIKNDTKETIKEKIKNAANKRYETIRNKIEQKFSENSSHLIKSLNKINYTPIELDDSDVPKPKLALRGTEKFYLDSWFSIVTETSFYEKNIFFSEKIYKPMVFKHPFLLLSSHNSLKYLRMQGFKTFNGFFNEIYDDIEDPDERMKVIFEETKRLCSLSQNQWSRMISDMQPILNHNFDLVMKKGGFGEY